MFGHPSNCDPCIRNYAVALLAIIVYSLIPIKKILYINWLKIWTHVVSHTQHIFTLQHFGLFLILALSANL